MSHSNTYHFILIDDNDIDLLLHHKIIELASPNTPISSFTNGEQALDYLKSIEQPESYIILLDIKMPLMDGFQFLDIFNHLEEDLKTHSKIFILSSSTNQYDISRANNNPLVSAMITKPLSKEHILRLLIS